MHSIAFHLLGRFLVRSFFVVGQIFPFPECEPGHFGFGCREGCGNCSGDASTSKCDAKTGACLKCPVGRFASLGFVHSHQGLLWKFSKPFQTSWFYRSGTNCQHSCEDGKWGQDCAEKCSCADGHKWAFLSLTSLFVSSFIVRFIGDDSGRKIGNKITCWGLIFADVTKHKLNDFRLVYSKFMLQYSTIVAFKRGYIIVIIFFHWCCNSSYCFLLLPL